MLITTCKQYANKHVARACGRKTERTGQKYIA